MNFHITPNHIQLIAACYPPSSTLLNAGPQYKPNSQELSRLTYYASNRPGKISKLGQHLLKNVVNDSRKAHAGNVRARASLLITLSIFKALLIECRRDLSLLSCSLISAIDESLANMPSDLEVIDRTANLFATWATYSDAHLIGADATFTKKYISTIKQFASMCLGRSTSKDQETEFRTRLAGFTAFLGLIGSGIIFASDMEFKSQITVIVPMLLFNIDRAPITILEEAAQENKVMIDPALSNARDIKSLQGADRRTSTLNTHADGDEGPTLKDVICATLKILSTLLNRSSGSQIGNIIRSTLDYFSEAGSCNIDNCRWIAQKVTEWTQYQYRYAVPTLFVERLLDTSDVLPQSDLVLSSMLAAVFKSPMPLINLSTSDILSNLMTVMMRRVNSGSQRAVLSSIVSCIVSLKTHIYYTDQIHDLACELLSRLAGLEYSGPQSVSSGDRELHRVCAVTCILESLIGLMTPVDEHKSDYAPTHCKSEDYFPGEVASSTSEVRIKRPVHERAAISAEAWLDSLVFLFDVDSSVRDYYAHALVLFVREEIYGRSSQIDCNTSDARSDDQIVAIRHATIAATAGSNPKRQFLQLLNVAIFLFVTAFLPQMKNGTFVNAVDFEMRTGKDGRHQADLESDFSILHRLLDSYHSVKFLVKLTVTNKDCDNILDIFASIHERGSPFNLLSCIPMLLALKETVQSILEENQAISPEQKVLVVFYLGAWRVIARGWGCHALYELAENAKLNRPQFFTDIVEQDEKSQETTKSSKKDADIIDASSKTIVDILASSETVQKKSKLDKASLEEQLGVRWSIDSAMKNPEQTSKSSHINPENHNIMLKISPALMQVDNLSLQSLTRSVRGIGISELREALDSRSGFHTYSPETRPPSISVRSAVSGERLVVNADNTRSRSPLPKPPIFNGGNADVHDILNQLGIGTQSGASTGHYTEQKSSSGASAVLPPYKM